MCSMCMEYVVVIAVYSSRSSIVFFRVFSSDIVFYRVYSSHYVARPGGAHQARTISPPP